MRVKRKVNNYFRKRKSFFSKRVFAVTEQVASAYKHFSKKDIDRLTTAFHEGNQSDIRKYVRNLMLGLGSEKSFLEDSEKLLKSYQFSDRELQDITGCTDIDEARVKINNVVKEVLEDDSFGYEAFSDALNAFFVTS